MADNTGPYVLYEQLIKELFISGSNLVTNVDTVLSNKVTDSGGDKFDFTGGSPLVEDILYQNGKIAEIINVTGPVLQINKTGIENLFLESTAKILHSDTISKIQGEEEIKLATAIIDRGTNQFFNAKSLTIRLEGNNSNLLLLSIPIISVSSIKLNNDNVSIDLTLAEISISRTIPDDRRNPKIKLRNITENIFKGTTGRVFRRGMWTEIDGVFGFLESDGSTPLLIQKAILKLTIRNIQEPTGSIATSGLLGPKKRERVDLHETEYFEPSTGGTSTISSSGDVEIDRIIGMYKAPLIISGSILDVPIVETVLL